MKELALDTALASDVKRLIQNAKQHAAAAVNAELTLLYWQVGTRMRDEVLKASVASTANRCLRGWRNN